MELIETNPKQLKELAYIPIDVRNDVLKLRNIQQPDQHCLVNNFVNSVKHSESIALTSGASAFTNCSELLHRPNECKNIKHLRITWIRC